MHQQLPSDPKARQHLRWTQPHEQVTKKVAHTCRYFGISRMTFYLWPPIFESWYGRPADKIMQTAQNSSEPAKDIREPIISLRLQRKYGARRLSFLKRVKNHLYSRRDLSRL